MLFGAELGGGEFVVDGDAELEKREEKLDFCVGGNFLTFRILRFIS